MKRLLRWMPLLHIYIEVPFFSLRTMWYGYSAESAVTYYVVVEVHLWKWQWVFHVFEPEQARQARKGR